MLYKFSNNIQQPDKKVNEGENSYLYRMSEIRDTVTKVKRVPFVSSRLRKCFTRSGFCQWHCFASIFFASILCIIFNDLPPNRMGIEKRENLFRVIVLPFIFID